MRTNHTYRLWYKPGAKDITKMTPQKNIMLPHQNRNYPNAIDILLALHWQLHITKLQEKHNIGDRTEAVPRLT